MAPAEVPRYKTPSHLNMELQRYDKPLLKAAIFLPLYPNSRILQYTIPCLDTPASPPMRTHQPPGQRLRHRIPQQTALPTKAKTLPTRCTRVPGLLPFGMVMNDRKAATTRRDYRYGYNGKESDNEVKGESTNKIMALGCMTEGG